MAGGRVYTADQAGSRWAEAVAVRNGRILAAGKEADLRELRGPQTGRWSTWLAACSCPASPRATSTSSSWRCARQGGRDPRDLSPRSRRGRAPARPGQPATRAGSSGIWIRGGGWNQSTWADGLAPHRALLDEAAPDIPVALDSKELHAVWANTAALRRAGIDRETADVAGGVIERDSDGEPTGVLRENAVELFSRAIPHPAWLKRPEPRPCGYSRHVARRHRRDP